MTEKHLQILGCRGIPASHGGFETFAERLALYLAERNWQVTVYCQEQGKGSLWEDEWRGIRLVHVPVIQEGAFGTVIFDWKSTLHASREPRVALTLGYNTAVFGLLYRLKGKTNLFNMDGLEWKRDKWGWPQKAWLYLNERIGCLAGHHLVADHPEIAKHLQTRVASEKITMIPYGADPVENANPDLVRNLGLEPDSYALVIARAEPENSILEIVRAFSQRKRERRLVVLGRYEPERSSYHRSVLESASDEVVFPGAIYDQDVVAALRKFCRLYIHGHTVGGTNPSLVEAMGASAAVLAHDNRFNRWVAGSGSSYFGDEKECGACLNELLEDEQRIALMRKNSKRRHKSMFTWERILHQYECLLADWGSSV